MRVSSPGKERGAPELGGVLPPSRRAVGPGAPCLSCSGSHCGVTRLLCLQSEPKVLEVFRNEVTGGTWRIFFSVSVETYSEQGSSAWWDV